MNTNQWKRILLGCAVTFSLGAGLAAQAPKKEPAKAPAKQPAKTPSKPAAQAAAKPAAEPGTAVRPPKLVIQSHVLANGLRLLIVEDHSAPLAHLQVWYHVGSKDEKPGRTGFAHLFEHLMFKGSAHVAPDEHSRIIEAVGGFDNAFTNDDVTGYWETFPSNILERILWLEADRLGSLHVDLANFTSEREVVKEERRVGVESRPYGRVIEDLYAAAFTVHPYRHTTIGSMEDLNNAKLEDVREFHRTYYRPDNATLVLVGDFAAAQALQWAQQYFSGIPRPTAAIPRVTAQEPPQPAERRLTKWYGSASPLPAVIAGYRVPAACTPDSYALNLASNILSQGESSRLFRKLVYQDQIAVQTAGFGNFTEHPNLFWAFAIMNQGKTAAQGQQAVDAELDRMKNEPVDATELEKAKNQIVSNLILNRQTVQQKAGALVRNAVLCRDAHLTNTELRRYLAVAAPDIQRVSNKYFVIGQRTIMVIEPPTAPKQE